MSDLISATPILITHTALRPALWRATLAAWTSTRHLNLIYDACVSLCVACVVRRAAVAAACQLAGPACLAVRQGWCQKLIVIWWRRRHDAAEWRQWRDADALGLHTCFVDDRHRPSGLPAALKARCVEYRSSDPLTDSRSDLWCLRLWRQTTYKLSK